MDTPLLPPILSWLLIAGVAASGLWTLSEAGRRCSIRGSKPRYIFASWERPLRWPALLYFVISAVIEARFYQDWVLFVTSCTGIALWLFVTMERSRRGDDDDDFWKKSGKRLRSWLTGRTSSPLAHPGR
ncbi:hypothetical protein ASF47_18895 [Nocardioides sp. Leaf285]|nr:hypothetical protein ASF47_18895 [Nocardioides sp. Leaf285]